MTLSLVRQQPSAVIQENADHVAVCLIAVPDSLPRWHVRNTAIEGAVHSVVV